MKRFFYIIFLLISHVAFGQLESNFWYFGDHAGISFSTNPPTALTNSAMFAGEGCATISSGAGNLLFYTDGITVFNKNHQMMDNGYGLFGHSSSTQSAVILQYPGSVNLYYIFTVDAENLGNHGVCYSTVDMSLNGGLGKVIIKNQQLFTPAAEKITVARHSNNHDWWIITHGVYNTNFYSYLVTSSGINLTPVVSATGSYQDMGYTLIGYMKISPNNHKLAYAKWYTSSLELFDFDNSSGVVSNPLLLSSNEDFYGVEFSPDNSKLYATLFNARVILQYNLLSANIAATRDTVGYGQLASGALQTGPDNKIYYSDINNDSLGVINNPNDFNCNFVSNAIYLNGKICKDGLPNFIPSLVTHYCAPNALFTIADTIICQGKTLIFTNLTAAPVTAQLWIINGIITDTSYHREYTFNNAGVYTISLVAFNDTCPDTASHIITVLPGSDTVLHVEICSGDTLHVGNSFYTNSGNFSDTLQNRYGCDSIISSDLTVDSPAEISLGRDTSLCDGETWLLTALTTDAIYLWSDGTSNPTLSVNQEGLYWVQVSKGACKSEDSVQITLIDCASVLELPNIVTPNNDGRNDIFTPIKIKNITKMKTIIFNRWGRTVYTTEDPLINWDCKNMADGVYYYVVDYTNYLQISFSLHGTVTLLR
jgi:gliding motility-associated-like protein